MKVGEVHKRTAALSERREYWLDVEGAYPTNEDVANISKETTFTEVARIEGVSEQTQRRNGINLTGGRVNSVQFCNEIYGLPSLVELEALF